MSASADAIPLRATRLTCLRGERRLFSEISFELAAGTLLQVRGPNGSGKTSLLRMVCGLLAPESGEISWANRPIRELGEEYRAQLAYVGHLNAVKDELDPAENLRHGARLAGLPVTENAIVEALRTFELGGCEGLPCKLLSQGQKRRVALARLALSPARPLWVLDEPLAALDARATQFTRTLIEAHLRGGGIALLALHQELDISAPAVRRLELAA